MYERPTLEVIAPTVEEALAQGLEQLGLSAADVSVEVLDAGSKGLFGLGGRQVRVRLTVNGPGGEMHQSLKPASGADPSTGSGQSRSAGRPSKPAARTEADPVLDLTESTVAKLMQHMGYEAQVSAHFDGQDRHGHRTIHVDVRGRDLNALIGRQAETLQAFQHVASLMVGKQANEFLQLSVDIEGHRARREKQLRQMAQRMADEAMKMGRAVMLEPMSASERRIVHMELENHPAVKTESVGEEPRRKVSILPKE